MRRTEANAGQRALPANTISLGLILAFHAGTAHCQTAPTTAAQPSSGPAVNLGTIPITAPALNPDGSSAASGGFAVPSQSFGPLGNTPVRDIPFSTISVPRTVIQDQQAHNAYDILKNDPSLGLLFSPRFSPNGGAFNIRGFTVANTDTRLDGLTTNTYDPAPEGVERVDVLTGGAAALYGFAAPAGVINFITKRPLDTPLTDVGVQYNSRLNAEETLDVSRRFGRDEQFGIRINIAQQDGEGAVDRTSLDRNFQALALDWKPIEGLRLWTNFQHEYYNYRGIDIGFLTSRLRSIPAAPNLFELFGQPWNYARANVLVATTGAEFDRDNWHLSAKAGFVQKQGDLNTPINGFSFLNQAGQYPVTAAFVPDQETYGKSFALDGGRTIRTGPIRQYVSVVYLQDYLRTTQPAQTLLNNLGISSLAAPRYIAEPNLPQNLAGDTLSRTVDRTLLATDRISIGDRVTVLAGVDRSSVEQFSSSAGLLTPANQQQSKVTPIAALQIEPISWATAYFSYVQALQPGRTSPIGAQNANQLLPPFVGTQYEVGVKADVTPGLQVGTALFQIDQAFAFLDPADNTFKASGTERHRGLELTAAGKLTADLSLLGGVTFINARINEVPQDTTGNDNKVSGVPGQRLTLFAEYAVPPVAGLTLIGGVYYTSSQYASQAGAIVKNLTIPGYVTLDVGARYETVISNTPVTARLYVSNSLNERYWASSYNVLNVGSPLSASASLTAHF